MNLWIHNPQILRLGRWPGERIGYPLQYSCLENFMDRGAWQATVHGVTKSQTQLSSFHFQLFYTILYKGLEHPWMLLVSPLTWLHHLSSSIINRFFKTLSYSILIICMSVGYLIFCKFYTGPFLLNLKKTTFLPVVLWHSLCYLFIRSLRAGICIFIIIAPVLGSGSVTQ